MLAIADVALTVKSATASADWWQEKLGFRTHTVGPPGSHALMVAPPGERFLLHLCEGIETPEAGNTGIAFMTDEGEALARRMAEAGVEFVEPWKPSDWGGMAKFLDPDGHVFWLIGAPASFIRQESRRRAPRDVRRPPGARRRHRRTTGRPRTGRPR